MPRPHNSGSNAGYFQYLSFNFLVSTVWAVMMVYDLAKLGLLFLRHSKDTNYGMLWLDLVTFVLLIALFVWKRKGILGLVSFAHGFFNSSVLAVSALALGLVERSVQSRLRFLGKIFIAISWLVLLASLASFACLLYLLPDSFPDNSASGSLLASLFHSLLLAVSLLGIVLSVPVAIGKANDWSAFATRPKLKDFIPEQHEGATFNLIHLSDLHITSNQHVPLTENPHSFLSNASLRALRKAIHSLEKKPAIVISGDTTDTGNREEWGRFLQYFGRFRHRIVLAPGNHDLNIVGYGENSLWEVADLPYLEGRTERMRAFFEVAVKVMGNRAQVLAGDKTPAFCPLKDAFSRIEQDAGSKQFNELSALFPLVVTVPDENVNLYAIVWNTTRPSAWPLFNSMGRIDDGQLKRFTDIEKLLEQNDNDASLMHVIHHKIAMPGNLVEHKTHLGRLKRSLQIAGMVMENASALVDLIVQGKKHTVIMHGHHHMRFVADVDNIENTISVISAPSTTLGCEGHLGLQGCGDFPGFDSIQLSVKDGNVSLKQAPTWTKVSSTPGKPHAAQGTQQCSHNKKDQSALTPS